MTTRAAAKSSTQPHHEPDPTLLAELAATAAAIAGMQPTMLDRRSVRQTFRQSMEATHLADPEAYAGLYKLSAEEQLSFLEGVLNGETSFFRDATVFAEMSRWCLDWFARHKRPMRILSAPCSTGEEPYSIAAMLEEAGVPLDRFTLEALDISSLALDHAQTAVYTGLSLRNLPKPAQSIFLERVAKGWRVKKHIRNHVRFRQANLLDDNALPHHAYDLICSRNLLIYQTPEARRRMAETLSAALAPGGRLIVGAADWGRDLDEFFRLEEPVNSFALRPLKPEDFPAKRLAQAPKSSAAAPGKPAKASSTNRLRAPAIKPDDAFLLASVQLADVTDLYRNALEAYLRSEEHEAERLCRQTLYLETDHLPSLELLARIHRPHASSRMQLALHARLKRHRAAAVPQGDAR